MLFYSFPHKHTLGLASLTERRKHGCKNVKDRQTLAVLTALAVRKILLQSSGIHPPRHVFTATPGSKLPPFASLLCLPHSFLFLPPVLLSTSRPLLCPMAQNNYSLSFSFSYSPSLCARSRTLSRLPLLCPGPNSLVARRQVRLVP